MPDSRSDVSINLIGKKGKSFKDDFFNWSISVGRIIIIITELIALGALIYRFTIDRKIVDLNDQIARAELFVRAQSDKEADYRSIQNRLVNIAETEEQSESKVVIMREILTSVSEGSFSSTNLTINDNRITINGVALSIFPLNAFIESLKQNPNVTSISLDEIISVSSGIQFKLGIELLENERTNNRQS